LRTVVADTVFLSHAAADVRFGGECDGIGRLTLRRGQGDPIKGGRMNRGSAPRARPGRNAVLIMLALSVGPPTLPADFAHRIPDPGSRIPDPGVARVVALLGLLVTS